MCSTDADLSQVVVPHRPFEKHPKKNHREDDREAKQGAPASYQTVALRVPNPARDTDKHQKIPQDVGCYRRDRPDTCSGLKSFPDFRMANVREKRSRWWTPRSDVLSHNEIPTLLHVRAGLFLPRAAYRKAINFQGRNAHADWHSLSVFSASAHAFIELQIVSYHRNPR